MNNLLCYPITKAKVQLNPVFVLGKVPLEVTKGFRVQAASPYPNIPSVPSPPGEVQHPKTYHQKHSYAHVLFVHSLEQCTIHLLECPGENLTPHL